MTAFLEPIHISHELATFMNVDPYSLHSRVDVTKYICNYISSNNLSDGRVVHINRDPGLMNLLRYTDSEPVSYLKIQSLLKIHYVTSEPVVAFVPEGVEYCTN